MVKFCECCGQPMPGSEEFASLFNDRLIIRPDGLHWGDDGFCRLPKTEAFVCLAVARKFPQPASREFVTDYLENCRELKFDAVDTRIIDVFICNIRKRMLDAGCPFHITTTWGLGKQFADGPANGRIGLASDYPRDAWKARHADRS